MNYCALFWKDVGQLFVEPWRQMATLIVFPTMFRTFPTNTMIKNGMNISSI
jgi:hypothetical protein